MDIASILQKHLDVLRTNRDNLMSSARHKEYMYNTVISFIRDETERFVQGGVVFVPENIMINLRQEVQVDIKSVFRKIAHDLGRDFIYAEEPMWKNTIILRLPASSRLRNLVAPLLLVTSDEGPVFADHEKRTWVFQFRRKDAKQLFHHWKEQCRTNPVMRITLNLPPPPRVTPEVTRLVPFDLEKHWKVGE